MKMFYNMTKKERKFYMLQSLKFLKEIKRVGAEDFPAKQGRLAHEMRFRKLWKNRHNEQFDYNAK